MEEKLSIHEMVTILKKRWKLIALLTFVAAAIGGSITTFILTPVYQASTQILVNQKDSKTQLDITTMRSNIDLINTYSVIIKSPAILENVIEDLALTESVQQLNQHITVTSEEDSQVFSLTVEDPNAKRAVMIANSVSETFQQNIKSIMKVDNVSILAKAELEKHPTPVKPVPSLYISIAIIAGLMIGIGLAFLIEKLDNTVKDGHDMEAYFGLPVLGSIQIMNQEKENRRTKREINILS